MARLKDREKAIQLRLNGASYSKIKEEIGVSKSTLSNWLRDYPLSEKRIKELRNFDSERIEKFRNTMAKKRKDRLVAVFNNVSKDIGELSEREFFLIGFFLYWAEGTKGSPYTTTMANTDPSMLKFFIKWLKMLDVSEARIKIKLHLYSDMDVKTETEYWMKQLKVSKEAFWKPYIKKSSSERINYRGRIGCQFCCRGKCSAHRKPSINNSSVNQCKDR